MPPRRTNPDFMTGVPEILILRLLAQREMYGYELVQTIHACTGEAIKLGEGVVYPILHVLEKRGHLKARRKSINGRTRVYYTLTATGKKRLQTMALEWNRINKAVSYVIGGASLAAGSV